MSSVFEKKRRKCTAEKVFEEIMAENLTNLVRDTAPFKKLSKYQSINQKKSRPKHIIMKLPKTKEKHWKAAR